MRPRRHNTRQWIHIHVRVHSPRAGQPQTHYQVHQIVQGLKAEAGLQKSDHPLSPEVWSVMYQLEMLAGLELEPVGLPVEGPPRDPCEAPCIEGVSRAFN